MSNQKTKSIAVLDKLRAQALEKALSAPPRVADKLRQNAELEPSKDDFNSEYEWKYRLDANDVSVYSDEAALIDNMRVLRQFMSNLAFAEEQGSGPHNSMTVSDDEEFNY